MSYVDGFVIPVKTSDKQAFIDHARKADQLLIDEGALRIVECWAEDVPEGKQTDFYRSVDRQEGETVCFSWIEWPDKATRDKAFAKMMESPELMAIAVPFDGKRMIFGGFTPLVVLEKSNG
ncbi:DUF1428 domain-containing protein [Sphingomonas ginkgonis]|uniref:DUF1428 domain-containing protein n=1 Tax=Sphingomonas ginkgonis TaxID=2315330 RepID=A0A429V7I8_9SPHN|nr:DUF1428 domain-containing protein [Sphingomonas ginkgonis]RST29884.1 DUF1428 domain-containing protein [Sphingomonas ginkgonis]